jgi:hypothetical protein
VATVDIAWQIASKPVMPPTQNDTAQATVRPTYTSHSARAVSAMRGVSLLSFCGPVLSARNSCMPPTFSIGMIATARITMPMPPRKFSDCR